jgi:hypothetical protein
MKAFLFILLVVSMAFARADDHQVIHENTAKYINGDKTAIKVLYAQSVSTKDQELRPYLAKVITLMMLKSASKKTSDYVKKMGQKYKADNLFTFLRTAPLKAECKSCKGFAKTLARCIKCKKGQCRNCKGDGFNSYGRGKSLVKRDCKSCKKTGYCPSCKGSEKISIDCRRCKKSGTIFNKAAIAIELKKSLNLLLHKSAQLGNIADFTVDENLFTTEKEDLEKSQLWQQAISQKKSLWLDSEEKRIATIIKKQQAANAVNNPLEGEVTVENYEEGGSTPTLDQITLEVSDYLKAQEKKAKHPFFVKSYGKFLSDIATIHIVVNKGFTDQNLDYRQRAGDGFYRFAVMRAERNGYAGIAVVMLNDTGEVIGDIKNGDFEVR